MKARLGLVVLVALAPALSFGGCASNKGETLDGPPVTPANPIADGFTSFSAIPKPGTSTLPGITTEASYTAPAPSFTVTGHSTPSLGAGSATLTLDANGNLTAININGAQSSVSFSAANGSSSIALAAIGAPNANAFESADRKNLAIVASPAGFGFDYQSFGIWATGRDTGSGNFGAISVGAATQNAALPTTGTTTYNGSAAGLYVDPAGQTFLAAGTATLTANFATRSVNYATSGTAAVSVATVFAGVVSLGTEAMVAPATVVAVAASVSWDCRCRSLDWTCGRAG